MAESTLAYSRDGLMAVIGNFLGYGRGAVYSDTAWTTQQSNNIDDLLKSALSQVYNPPLVNGQSHNWSFLRPFLTLSLVSGEKYAALPDDFGGFSSPLYIVSDSPRRPWSVPLTTPERVESEHTLRPTTSGAPQLAAEFLDKGTRIDRGQRSRLYVWPTPDAAYELRAEYYFIPDALTGATPFPPGGALHGELFKASCMAAAELQLDDMKGTRWDYFMERLGAAMAADRKRKGDQIGYNGDMSDAVSGRSDWARHGYGNAVTFNGQLPG